MLDSWNLVNWIFETIFIHCTARPPIRTNFSLISIYLFSYHRHHSYWTVSLFSIMTLLARFSYPLRHEYSGHELSSAHAFTLVADGLGEERSGSGWDWPTDHNLLRTRLTYQINQPSVLHSPPVIKDPCIQQSTDHSISWADQQLTSLGSVWITTLRSSLILFLI